MGDILTKDTFNNLPDWDTYQDYCLFDRIMNERCALKAVYFAGGFPMSAMSITPPSGDFLFQHFYSENFKHLSPSAGYCPELYEEEFGMCYTESMPICYNYDIFSKDFIAKGICKNERYNILVQSIMNSISGFTHKVEVENVPIDSKHIKMSYSKSLDVNLNDIKSNSGVVIDITNNINLWNKHNKFDCHRLKNSITPVKFLIESLPYKKKCSLVKELIKTYWNNIELVHCIDDNTPIKGKGKDSNVYYFIECNNDKFWKGLSAISNKEEIRLMNVKCSKTIDENQYTIIANNYFYFVLKNEEIYDWNIVTLPRFESTGHPIFNIAYPEGKLTYGISIDMSIGSW